MNTVTAKTPLRVLLDTNILVSSLIYGGKPEQVETLILEKQVIGITSLVLLSELIEVLGKKFRFNEFRLNQVEKKIKKNFVLVQPSLDLDVLRDSADNRILEAATEGDCDFIITGDKELLKLGRYRGIKILTCDDFLRLIEV